MNGINLTEWAIRHKSLVIYFMFSLNPIPARIRCRHASFWRSSSSTPSGGSARGFHIPSDEPTASTRAR